MTNLFKWLDFFIFLNTSLTISFPPTSTANISRYFNIHSIYYDPTSTIDPKDEALFGIRLIRGFEELKDYATNELLIWHVKTSN